MGIIALGIAGMDTSDKDRLQMELVRSVVRSLAIFLENTGEHVVRIMMPLACHARVFCHIMQNILFFAYQIQLKMSIITEWTFHLMILLLLGFVMMGIFAHPFILVW
jgi:hypothetical protein